MRETDPRPYFQILHGLFRADGSDAEIERTELVMQWVLRGRVILDRVFSKVEMNMVGYVWDNWTKYNQCPTRNTVELLVVADIQARLLLDLLKEYDKHEPYLLKVTHADMDTILSQRVREHEQVKLLTILENVEEIATVGGNNPAMGKNQLPEKMKGTRDAINYLILRMQMGILIDDERPEGGSLGESVGQAQKAYNKAKVDRLSGRLTIPTGLDLLDKHLDGGLRRAELNGILGFSGQRKTALLRSIAYSAASAGFRVLHIPLESSYMDEVNAYTVMHAHRLNPTSSISISGVRCGNLTPQQEKELWGSTAEDLGNPGKTLGTKLTVRDAGKERTWAHIRSIIENECRTAPVDLVVIDYLSLLNDPHARDAAQAMTRIIQDAKQLAMRANDGEGLCLLTPVQGNRGGYAAAQANDGAWETSGISQYSELDKSLDNCLYVFTNDDISREGQLKIGSCKARNGENMPATFVRVNKLAGMVVSSSESRGLELGDHNPSPITDRSQVFGYRILR
jgi:hypothetical protein